MERIKGKKRDKAFERLVELLKENPDLTFNGATDLNISAASFQRWRQKIRGKGVVKIGRKSNIDYSPIDTYLKANPNSSYAVFQKDHPEIKMSDAAYYARRRKLEGKPVRSVRPVKKQLLYMTFCSFPSKDYTLGGKLLKEFIQKLREDGRANFEIVELADPPIIEIREVTKR